MREVVARVNARKRCGYRCALGHAQMLDVAAPCQAKPMRPRRSAAYRSRPRKEGRRAAQECIGQNESVCRSESVGLARKDLWRTHDAIALGSVRNVPRASTASSSSTCRTNSSDGGSAMVIAAAPSASRCCGTLRRIVHRAVLRLLGSGRKGLRRALGQRAAHIGIAEADVVRVAAPPPHQAAVREPRQVLVVQAEVQPVDLCDSSDGSDAPPLSQCRCSAAALQPQRLRNTSAVAARASARLIAVRRRKQPCEEVRSLHRE